MKKQLNNKGFSMIEILAVIVIIGALSLVAITAATRYIKQQRYKNYDALIKTAVTAADEYIIDHPYETKFTFQELYEKNYIDTLTDPKDKTKDCRGKIKVRKVEGSGKLIDQTYYTINYCCEEFNRTYDSESKAISDDERCKADPYDLNLVPLIKVLNVYPTTGADQLKGWMQTYGLNPVTGDRKITVDTVPIENFNNNPAAYLKNGSSWKYNEIVFGFWDCNGSKDLSPSAASLVNQFLNEGGAAIFGHDTILIGCSQPNNFNSLAHHVGISIRSGYSFQSSTKVKIARKGIFTEFPWNIGTDGTILTIPLSHVSGQTANGEVWMTFEGTNDTDANKIYLSTYGNNAFIQTGHSSGAATVDEQKIIANIIFYMVAKQYVENED